ncbi:MAG TPA: SDR family oxidoreductase [Bacteroidia bacterium]|jgi:3-oxoacyl-[acyl-carrier protein] reductase
MDLNLSSKNAIVCGSTQGIGKASAIEIALLGANVTLVARNEDALKKTIGELDSSKGQKHNYIVADFSDPASLKEKVAAYVSKNASVHILVNNTGGPKGGPIINAQTDEFTQAFSAHLICNHILVQALVEGMKKEKYGRIINIISTSVKQPLKNLGVSNTIRAAVGNWAKTLSLELAQFGITVNNVLPGMTDTQRIRDLLSARSKATGKSVEELEKEMLAEIPAGRVARPAEVAAAVAFLATPAAAYINGINVPVDGGRTGNL